VDSFLAGSFTYKFKRSTKHTETCNCVECEFRKNTLESDDFKQFISQETSLKNPQLFESFVSVYESGDFLSMHTDVNRGVAFILNLTAGWRPEYGGMLHIKTDNEIKAIPPVYNSFVLLGLKNGAGIPHFVSEVSQYVPYPRIAISGWYNEGS
jgi:Rps23 Pro-64 3,4-dihydroxylase Tpa1-like proline 4-hydroxylase